MISWIMKTSCLYYLPQPSASADNTDLGFDNSWNHAQPHPIIVYYHQHQHQGDLTLGWSLDFFCDVNKDLLRSFIVNKECRFLCHFFDMFNTKPTQRWKLETLSIDKGDGSENVTFKMNWRFFQLCRVYFNSLKIANVGQFPWSWFLWDRTQVWKQKEKFVVACLRPP